MTGTWVGYYKYDNQRIQKAFGFDKTKFTIIINSFDGRNFEGTVFEDINTGGMNGTGVVIGKIDDEIISFKKYMPRKHSINNKGEKKELDEKHPTLYYTGKFSNTKKEISGVWKFRIAIALLFNFIPFPYRPCKGTWCMTLQ